VNVTCQREKWDDFVVEALPLFRMNYNELSIDKATIPLDVREEEFSKLEGKGVLHAVTARDDGKLIGYHISALLPHMHYASAGLMAYTDVYFLHPAFRRGTAGIKLLQEVERTLKERGIKKFYMSTKAHSDNGPLLQALGYKLADHIYTKLL
jgi:GNAT superfamily N-acetyltransferase